MSTREALDAQARFARRQEREYLEQQAREIAFEFVERYSVGWSASAARAAADVLGKTIMLHVDQLLERAEKAEAQVREMIEKAAANKLDGYHELGERAASAENTADDLRRKLTQVERERDEALLNHHRTWPDCPRCVELMRQDEEAAMLNAKLEQSAREAWAVTGKLALLLERIKGWDHLPFVGDGPFWIREIEKGLELYESKAPKGEA